MVEPRVICILASGDYKVGDQPPWPDNFWDWMDWAEVQHKGKLRQTECPRCLKFRYPQESCMAEDVCPTVEIREME